MRAVGLITEYNPFHNGHLHHLRESRRAAGAEVAVAVMSGHFLQRGEPALVDKWLRAEMALRAGVDVVVELPLPWACNSAPHFAAGAVAALQALGGVEALCFGSEAGELAPLQRCAELLLAHEAEVEWKSAALLRDGVSYPAARARVFAEITADAAAAAVLGAPNNILGIEYLKALGRAGTPLRPLTVPRLGPGYHELQVEGAIASATGIRRRLAAGEEVAALLPAAAWAVLRPALEAGCSADPQLFFRLLLGRILRGPASLRHLYQVEHGIENRLFAAAEESGNLEELLAQGKSRQLTRTRIQRLLCYLLLEARQEEMTAFLGAGPLYLHLLGASERGRRFLADGRKTRTLPLVENYSRIFARLRRAYGTGSRRLALAEAMLELELRASRLYTLLLPGWTGTNRSRDFFAPAFAPTAKKG